MLINWLGVARVIGALRSFLNWGHENGWWPRKSGAPSINPENYEFPEKTEKPDFR